MNWLSVIGWSFEQNPGGQMVFTSADYEWQVIFTDHLWELLRFTDSDVQTECGPVAKGRYRPYDDNSDGTTLEELQSLMISAGAVEAQ